MESVMAALLESRPSRPESIVTYREGSALSRVLVFSKGLARLAVWCRGPGLRVVHVHATVRGSLVRKALCVLVARALGRPVLLQVHAGAAEVSAANPPARARTRLLGHALRRASATVAVSQATAVALERSFGLCGVGVVPNPAPVAATRSAPPRAAGRPVRALYLGGFLNPVKGGDVLLEAVSLLPRDSVELVMAGPGTPPAGHDRVATWRGWLDGPKKEAALAEADILVLPSLSEGLPVALLDGLANGLAVLATRVGGIPEVCEDEREALLVAPGDPRALAGALARLAEDGELRRRLGGAGRARAERMSTGSVLEELEKRYHELTRPAARSAPARAPRRLFNRSGDVVFLSYHSTADDGPEFLSLSPKIFEAQLGLLRRRGYRSGGHHELRRLAAGETLEAPTVFLTFDDGFRDTYEIARPLLESYGFRAMVFLLPTLLDEGAPLAWPEVQEAARRWPGVMRAMTWEMVEEMAGAGHEFGAHTLTHPRLIDVSNDQLARELAESRARVIERLGTCDSVAYPFGQWDDRVASAAAQAGFEFGFSLPLGSQRTASCLTIPRINVDHRDGPVRFGLKLSGPGRRLLFSPVKPALRALLRRERQPGTRYAAQESEVARP
jgi:glycosyltransferase involved in cell wall biosynthesis/peptidoglycan/xylan/chitin deacetylase (PgdA/CDA1 family)